MQHSPDAGTKIETVEMHTGGEPVRIVTAGYPRIEGKTLLDKRRFAREHLDRFRALIMFEPRGHYDMYGVLPVQPDHPEADLAVLFIHNEGYSTMCGHATIALGRYAFDRGLIEAEGEVARLNLQCPCGLVRVTVALDDGKPGLVSFVSVPRLRLRPRPRCRGSGNRQGHRRYRLWRRLLCLSPGRALRPRRAEVADPATWSMPPTA